MNIIRLLHIDLIYEVENERILLYALSDVETVIFVLIVFCYHMGKLTIYFV